MNIDKISEHIKNNPLITILQFLIIFFFLPRTDCLYNGDQVRMGILKIYPRVRCGLVLEFIGQAYAI